MLSDLGRIFGIPPRQAESTDARMELRRNDPDQNRSPRKDTGDDAESLQGSEDLATVSVAALLVFLKNFLNSSKTENRQNRQRDTDFADQQTGRFDFGDDASEGTKFAAASPNAMAAQAYQTMAEKSAAPAVSAHDSDARQDPLPLDLAADDVRLIYTMMDDLNILIQKGVEFIQIERAENFLQSLKISIDKAMRF